MLQHHLRYEKGECDNSALVKVYEKNNSAYDIWMLGILLLEIATGCPIWIDKKCILIGANGQKEPLLGRGIFGIEAQNKSTATYIRSLLYQQEQVVQKVKVNLKRCETYGLAQNDEFMDLMTRMLAIKPEDRITPKDIINHPYCKQRINV